MSWERTLPACTRRHLAGDVFCVRQDAEHRTQMRVFPGISLSLNDQKSANPLEYHSYSRLRMIVTGVPL